MMQFEITCFGILVVDVIASRVDRVPHGSTLLVVDDISMHAGGSALNTACVLAKWGQHVSLVGRVGQDVFGDWLVGVVGERGVNAAGVARDPAARTSTSIVLVDTAAERTFLHQPGANASILSETLDVDGLWHGDALHVAGALVMPGIDGEPMSTLLEEAQMRGVVTSLDTTFDSTGQWERIRPCLPYCQLFAPGIDEARAITGEVSPQRMATTLVDFGIHSLHQRLRRHSSRRFAKPGRVCGPSIALA